MEILKQKIKNIFSRKFLISAAIVASGIGTALKTANNPSVQIIGIVVACVAACVYAIVEGMVDTNSIEAKIEGAIAEVNKVKEEAKDNE